MPTDPTLPTPSDFQPPVYAQVALELQKQLSRMEVGDKLPSERQLCSEFNVSRVTIRKAMESLHREGYLETRRGGGTRLAKKVSPPLVNGQGAQRLIGLIVPTVENSLISRIVQGFESFATEVNYHVALAHDHGDMDLQIKQLRRMVESGVHGLAVYPDTENLTRPEFYSLIKRIEENELPLVMIDRYVPSLETTSVMSDNCSGMYAATEHLILSGHRRLALLSFGPDVGVVDRERRKGFLLALKDYNLTEKPVFDISAGISNHEITAHEAVAAELASKGGQAHFDGIVCMQDNMAYGAFLALREAGLDVPGDIGLVGYDNLNRELFQASGLRLTSIDQPAEKIGQEAARLLIHRIQGATSQSRAQHVLLKPSLVIRTSCGAAAAEEEVLSKAIR